MYSAEKDKYSTFFVSMCVRACVGDGEAVVFSWYFFSLYFLKIVYQWIKIY